MVIEIGAKVRAKCDLTLDACGDHPAMTVAFRGTEGVVTERGLFGFDWSVRMRTTARGQPLENVWVYAREIEPATPTPEAGNA